MFESPPFWMYAVGFLLLLGPLITVHELGHYLVGRWFGVKADAFSIGFGKEIAGFTDRRGTRWKLGALPLGGYVQFAGDMSPTSQPDAAWRALPEEERRQTFPAQAMWKRSLIVLAGPVTNFLLAIAIFAGFNMAYGRIDAVPRIGQVEAGSVAAQAGLRAGDEIVGLYGEPLDDFMYLRRFIGAHPGEEVALTIERDGARREVEVTLASIETRDRFGNEFRIGQLGIYPTGEYEVTTLGPGQSVTLAFRQTGETIDLMVTGIWQIVTGRRALSELGGPVKIAKFSGEQLSLGWVNFVQFAALISINLAFINLLPIPALDGGHLAFYAAEAVRRKPLGPRSQEWAFRTGIALVLALMLFVTINDIASLPLFGR